MLDPHDHPDLFDEINALYDALEMDEEHAKLRRIVLDELIETQKVMARSPMLQAKGKSVNRRTLAPEFDGLPIEEGEDWYDYLDRVEAEGERRGAPLVQPWIIEKVTCWELTSGRYLYTEGQWIGTIENDELRYVSLDFAAKPALEIIIQDLRLLRTPFNGAVLEGN